LFFLFLLLHALIAHPRLPIRVRIGSQSFASNGLYILTGPKCSSRQAKSRYLTRRFVGQST